MLKNAAVVQPRLDQPSVYQFSGAPWRENSRYNTKFWLSWGWCSLDEVVVLINQQFGLRWTRAGLLKRFAIPREKGLVRRNSTTPSPDLRILWLGANGELHFDTYSEKHLASVFHWDMKPYVPVGWVKPLLWALSSGCTRAGRETTEGTQFGLKYACFENGEGLYYM